MICIVKSFINTDQSNSLAFLAMANGNYLNFGIWDLQTLKIMAGVLTLLAEIKQNKN